MSKNKKMETLVIGGVTYKTQLTEKFVNRSIWKKPNEKMIKAYIPGNILEIFVKEGQKVKKGEKLLILEAMKMRNVIATPVSGKIKAIHAKKGIMVPKNELLVEIE
jgi:biotin carboxyl carrier protein